MRKGRNSTNNLYIGPTFKSFRIGNPGIVYAMTTLSEIVRHKEKNKDNTYLIETNGNPGHFAVVPVLEAYKGFKSETISTRKKVNWKWTYFSEKKRKGIVTITSSEIKNLENLCFEAKVFLDSKTRRYDHKLVAVAGDPFKKYNTSQEKINITTKDLGNDEISRIYAPANVYAVWLKEMIETLPKERIDVGVESISLREARERVKRRERRKKTASKIKKIFRKVI